VGVEFTTVVLKYLIILVIKLRDFAAATGKKWVYDRGRYMWGIIFGLRIHNTKIQKNELRLPVYFFLTSWNRCEAFSETSRKSVWGWAFRSTW
jgi:hypothetical protein